MNVNVDKKEADALFAYLEMAYDCFGPGADDVIAWFDEETPHGENLDSLLAKLRKVTK